MLNEPFEKTVEAEYSISPNLFTFLEAQNLTICLTSYETGQLYLIGRNPRGGIMINTQPFGKAMGLFVDDKVMHLATGTQIHRLENCLNANERAEELFDHCFVPRTTHTTGPLDAHDVAVDRDGNIVFVNTRFNCIARTSTKHSFETVWKPPFISRIVSEDRCHLNGMAMVDGALKYVTAISKSDTIDGWRDRRRNGGIVLNTQTDQVICEGLSMPHSPRVHQGELWVLNSGTGQLGIIDLSKSPEDAFTPQIFCPGFVRGLAFHNRFAFIGLSRPRYKRFEGLALDGMLKEADSEPWCGVQIVDLEKREVVAWLRIDGNVQEMYDVAVMPGVECAMSLNHSAPQMQNLVTWPAHLDAD
ncbi:TIGR03032 family protein [Sulfitobacter donghicola]|uniref:Conserved hypothetical protein CHP03032 domain-containing protein n=1 Tax=Sulfitobacter donghicola DSW-25 = KCTC 12864 = JCM 14565 TaxID=1300350 RepID=A0A073IGP8_9RHOB|nr:TIGR03032 family protein [Sulfitobacter donghicola]KEJ88681.1 hypothetical protein DSW25_13545 [Sulfitobacter donghicola DSW-25 = KCTC 12864 = JCM 14565]KIN68452.1 GCN5-related N-acetyltransferase [Sulfitobacter donghicola DSW-25 = KCTC 12864 = JCM 14565]